MPVIGVTTDLSDGRIHVRPHYAEQIRAAGGVPVLLSHEVAAVPEYLGLCDGFVFSGGDDPIMEHWGIPTHPKATPVDPKRQAFELALLDGLAERPGTPVLGICLGMQMMSLHAGGELDQHLPDSHRSSGAHWGRVEHPVQGTLGDGTVFSHHRQAITDPGILEVAATSHDGLIEAVLDADRPYYVGVQWHPERTTDLELGPLLFEQLVRTSSLKV